MKTDSKLVGVQYLRGIAALMVVYYHLQIQVPALMPYLVHHGIFDTGRLNSGVDIFFVISGFVMLITSRDSAPGPFFLRRLARVAPLYWLLTTALVAIVMIAPDLFRTTQVSWPYFLKSLLFIPFVNAARDEWPMPLLAPGWSLNMEMFFYAIFALTLLAPRRLRLTLCGAIFGGLVLAGVLAPELRRSALPGLYMQPYVLEFWLGMLIGQWYLRGGLGRIPSAVALVPVGFALLLMPLPGPLNHLPMYFFGSGAVVLGVCALECRYGIAHVAALELMGDASYSIYLTHIFTLGIMRVAAGRMHLEGGFGAIAFVALAMAATMLVAIGVYRWVEFPLSRMLTRRIQMQVGGIGWVGEKIKLQPQHDSRWREWYG